MNARHHFQIAGHGEHIFHEAGAVVVVNLADGLTDFRWTHGGGINRQISALGVATDVHGAVVGIIQLPDVVQCQMLGGDGLLEAHIKVFLPANQSVVRAPEDCKQTAVIQQ